MSRYLAAILCLLMPLGNGSLAWGDTAPAATASPAATPNPHSNTPACPLDKKKLEDECNPPPRAPSCETCHGATAQAE